MQVGTQREHIDLLLEIAAQGCTRLLSADRDDRLMIGLRVIQAREQMNAARSGSPEAHPDFAGELRVAAGHERRGFLVSRLNELDRAIRAVERADQSVNAVSGIAVDAPHPHAAICLTRKSLTVSAMSASRKSRSKLDKTVQGWLERQERNLARRIIAGRRRIVPL